MSPDKRRPEIDNHTMKLIVGVIALSLAPVTSYLSATPLDSISASYWAEGDWPRNILVGFLFAIGAFLLSYNGYTTPEMMLSKVAAFASVGVAMFPCRCEGHEEIIPGVHYISAAVMFGILAIFCYFFFQRAWTKGWAQARIRGLVYAICGLAIVLSISLMALDFLTDEAISQRLKRFTFYAEATGLVMFGIAWLTASRVLPLITRSDERMSILPFRK